MKLSVCLIAVTAVTLIANTLFSNASALILKQVHYKAKSAKTVTQRMDKSNRDHQ